jgi:hypothetical protein
VLWPGQELLDKDEVRSILTNGFEDEDLLVHDRTAKTALAQ